jgi:hypothetical protein
MYLGQKNDFYGGQKTYCNLAQYKVDKCQYDGDAE